MLGGIPSVNFVRIVQEVNHTLQMIQVLRDCNPCNDGDLELEPLVMLQMFAIRSEEIVWCSPTDHRFSCSRTWIELKTRNY